MNLDDIMAFGHVHRQLSAFSLEGDHSPDIEGSVFQEEGLNKEQGTVQSAVPRLHL